MKLEIIYLLSITFSNIRKDYDILSPFDKKKILEGDSLISLGITYRIPVIPLQDFSKHKNWHE